MDANYQFTILEINGDSNNPMVATLIKITNIESLKEALIPVLQRHYGNENIKIKGLPEKIDGEFCDFNLNLTFEGYNIDVRIVQTWIYEPPNLNIKEITKKIGWTSDPTSSVSAIKIYIDKAQLKSILNAKKVLKENSFTSIKISATNYGLWLSIQNNFDSAMQYESEIIAYSEQRRSQTWNI